MKKAWHFLTDVWCYVAHPDPMWPVHGQYRCPSCHRLYPVPWERGSESRLRYRRSIAGAATPDRRRQPSLPKVAEAALNREPLAARQPAH